jgi:flagellar biosynthesis GTPase FlhF
MITKYALPFAGLLALSGASCASTSQQASESPNPTTREVASSQKASEEALKRAQDAQKQATDQSQKAAEAQARVRQDQEKLRQDEETARQEQAKAQQLQTQARQESEQAARQTQHQQQRAAAGLSQQTQEIARGQQTAAGIVTQVRPDEVVVQPASGQAMRFRVDDSTDVRIEGRKSSADQIREGQQARVSYEPSANGPSAVSIVVSGAGATQGMGSGRSSGTTSEPQTQTPESQSPAPQNPSESQGPSQSHGY